MPVVLGSTFTFCKPASVKEPGTNKNNHKHAHYTFHVLHKAFVTISIPQDTQHNIFNLVFPLRKQKQIVFTTDYSWNTHQVTQTFLIFSTFTQHWFYTIFIHIEELSSWPYKILTFCLKFCAVMGSNLLWQIYMIPSQQALYMWPNTTKGTSCLLLNKLRFLDYLTEYLTSFPMIPKLWQLKWYFWKYNFYKVCIFYFLFFYFNIIFFIISE